MTERVCYFCGQINGDPRRDLIAHLLPETKYVRRVMLENGAFAVIPSLGPLTEGHSLLCSKMHLRSFSALPLELCSELAAIKQELKQTLANLYGGAALVFEHGMAADGDRVPCTVDHAHMHFVPLGDIREMDVIPELQWQVCDGSITALRSLAAGREYLLLETSDGVSRIATAGAQGFESQLMRRVVAEHSRLERHWNWREEPNPRAAHVVWTRFTSRGQRPTIAAPLLNTAP